MDKSENEDEYQREYGDASGHQSTGQSKIIDENGTRADINVGATA